MEGSGAGAMQIKGPQMEETEKIKGTGAGAMQIKGPQREENEKIKGADAEAIYTVQGPARGGEEEK